LSAQVYILSNDSQGVICHFGDVVLHLARYRFDQHRIEYGTCQECSEQQQVEQLAAPAGPDAECYTTLAVTEGA